MSDDPTAPATYRDAAARLQRVVDAQIATLREIDDRAVALLRLVATLLTALASAAGVTASLAGSRSLPPVGAPAAVAGGLAVLALVACTVAAAITYLGGRFVPGPGAALGDELSDGTPPALPDHLRRVLATQAGAIRANRVALAANARRFRVALAGLLAGVGFGVLAAALYLGRAEGVGGALALVATTALVAGLWWYLLTGRDLALPDRERAVGGPDPSLATVAAEERSEATEARPGAARPYPVAVVARGERRRGADGESERRE